MKRTLLIVDDQYKMVKFLSREFKKSGFEVLEATDGETALELYKTHKPNVTLVDMVMPRLSGEKVIKKIKKLNPSAKVVSMSEYDGMDTKAKRVGVETHLSKPMDIEEVGLILNQLAKG